MKLGVYDPPQRLPWAGYTYETVVNSPKHQQLALEAARRSIVLLKNENATLPLKKGLGSHRGDRAERRRGGGPGRELQRHAGRPGDRARRDPGGGGAGDEGDLRPGRAARHGAPGPARRARTPRSRRARRRSQAGPLRRVLPAATSTTRPCSSGWTPRSTSTGRTARPAPCSTTTRFSVRWTGAITAPATGRYTLGVRCATQCRLFVDGKPVAQGRSDHEPVTITGSCRLRAGQSVPDPPGAGAREVRRGRPAPLGDAGRPGRRGGGGGGGRAGGRRGGDGARALSSRLEGEEMPVRIEGFAGGDRSSLDLPKVQQQLMEKVVAAAKGKPVVLVLHERQRPRRSAGPTRNVPAIVEAWYGGQAGGTAVGRRALRRREPGGPPAPHLLPLGRRSSRPSTTTR